MNQFIAFSRLIRLPNLLIIVITQYAIRFGIIYPILNSIIDNVQIELQLSELSFFLLVLSTVMIAAAGYIINDYFDLKIDRVNRPTKIIVGKYIKRRVAMGAHIVINSIAIAIAGYLAYKLGNLKLISIQLISIGALWYYSVYFKKRVLIGNIIVAILAALVPFVSGLYELLLQHSNATKIITELLPFLDEALSFDEVVIVFKTVLNNIMLWVIGFSFFAFLSTIIREIIKDIEDYDGDKKYFSNTLPVVHGKKRAGTVAQFFAIIMIALLSVLQYRQVVAGDIFSAGYFLIAIQVPLVYVIYRLSFAKEKEIYSQLSKAMKLIMLLGLSYTIVSYYSIMYPLGIL